MSECRDESEEYVDVASWKVLRGVDQNRVSDLEERIIALERGLEGVLRRLEASGQAEDEAGWFGRPE